MTPTMTSPIRTNVGRVGVVLIAGLLLFLVYQRLPPREPPPFDETAVRQSLLTFTRARWRSWCEASPTVDEVGLYTENDRPCRPSRYVSLGWLQNQLHTVRGLDPAEYLAPAQTAGAVNCVARIWANTEAAPRGWLCIDFHGLYRTDNTGRDEGDRWVAWGQ